MPMKEPYRVPLKFRLSRFVLRPAFRGIFRILANVTITGTENIPFGRPYVAAINHISIFDPPFAGAFWPEPLEVIGAADVFDKPGQGLILKAYGVIPVHRGDYDRGLLVKIIHILNSGLPLLIAPEGGRSHVPAMRRAKPGVGYIVEQTGVPVLPVGLVGTTEDFWHRATHGDRPSLEMRIGRPITFPAITVKGAERHALRQRYTDLVMSHLAGLLPEEYRGAYAGSAIPSA
jgi:1-acyl-sn-glycerol-3-phosphate acyltransferase